ncbi:hypothetical protein [Dyella silvatica]|uniref:hypothetical protein n=1 Tax=Dyella silvatica TaxID=2992128 RepID=UPI002254E522|nr:hypothetical protein [Dyella silvatica]
MKTPISLTILLVACGLSQQAAASMATPSINGVVQRVNSNGKDAMVTVNGHTYNVPAGTKFNGTNQTPQAGQSVQLDLTLDGKNVIGIHTLEPTASHH